MSSDKNFWLIAIDDSWLSVALVLHQSTGYQVASIGPKIVWNGTSESLVTAIDSSLSSAANQAGLPPEDEPQKAAFILPPFWVGSDGKIVPEHLKQIEHICKSLVFKPMGFIANDEAIVEEANLREGLPVSFVLVNLSTDLLTVSLVYLGKVKSRIRKVINNEFTPEIIDNALVEMNVGNALPPQIVVFGDYSVHSLNLIKSYNWINNKNSHTFLHLPEVDIIEFDRIFAIFSQTIVSQIDVTSVIASSQSSLNSYETVEVIPEDIQTLEDETDLLVTEEVETPPTEDPLPPSIIPESQDALAEVSASDFGFAPAPTTTLIADPIPQPPVPLFDKFPENLDTFVDSLPPSQPAKPPVSVPKNAFPKPALPKISFNPRFPKMSLLAATLFGILVILVVPVIISSANVTLFVTPYTFSKTLAVTLDSNNSTISPDTKIIPVSKKEFDVTASASIKTTGVKTTGDKAKGEVIIFNQLNKSQTVAKGTTLLDPQGRKFELLTSIVVAASSLDLQNGTITMGQTRAMVSASAIGSEFNIAKDTKLTFKDTAESSLVARSGQAFTGGFSKQIAAVAVDDKTQLEQKLNDQIKQDIDAKTKSDVKNLAGAILDTLKIDQNRVVFGREVNEEAEELEGNIKASVTIFSIDPTLKSQIVKDFLGNDENYAKSDADPEDYSLTFKVTKLESDKASAQMTIVGKSLPKIDQQAVKQSLVLKTDNQINTVIKKAVPRAYDFNVTQKFAGLLRLMPLNINNITLDIKTEN